MQIVLKIDDDATVYLRTCARIRKISPTALCKRVMAEVVKDQLVHSILDDAKSEPEKRPGEYGYSDLRAGVRAGR